MKHLPILHLTAILALIVSLIACGGGGGGGGDGNSSVDRTSAPVLSVTSSYDTYGQSRDVFKDGDIVYVADGTSGLIVLQITKFNTLRRIGSLALTAVPLQGRAYALAKKDNYLYMASIEEGLYVIDVSDPSTPFIADQILLSGNPKFLSIKDNLLFISADLFFIIMDITNPATPSVVGELLTTSSNQHIVIDNDIAYIAAYNKGLRIVNVSNPSSPVLLSETSAGYNAIGIAKFGKHIYIGGGGSGVLVYNVADAGNPSFVKQLSSQQEGPFGISVWKSFLFLANGSDGIEIIDITTPTSPVAAGGLDTPGDSINIDVDDLTIINADSFSGVQLIYIFETTDIDKDGYKDGEDAFPNDPSEWLDTDGDSIGNNADTDDDNDGVLDSDDAFPLDETEWADTDSDGVGDNSDVFINNPSEWADSDVDGTGDNSDPANSVILTYVSAYDSVGGQSRGTLKEGNIIYVADGTNGLLILQVASNGTLNAIGSYDTTGAARSLAKINQYLYMACREEGLIVLDVSDPTAPVEVATISTTDAATFLTLNGATLYLSDRNNLQIFDVSIPQSPQKLSELPAITEFEHVLVFDGVAYIAGYYNGLFTVDVSDPENPTIMKNSGGVGGALWAVEKYGTYIFTGGEGSGLKVYDVEDPYNPSLVASLDLPSSADPLTVLDQPPFHMKVLGSYLFIADGEHGIQVVNISNPASPVIEAGSAFDTPGNAFDFYIDGYTIIIGDYNNGIRMVNLGSNLDHDGDGIPNYLDAYPLIP